MIRPFHPLADVFPLIEGEDFDKLVASVMASNGPREPIIEFEGMILDGRNRARACEAAGVEARYSPLPAGVDPVEFVIDMNIRRRHLTNDQRRMLGAELVNMKQGRPSEDKTLQSANITRERAAELATADVPGIDRARSVLAHGDTQIIAAVKEGKLSVATAAEIASQPPERQAEIVVMLPRTADGKLTPEVRKALAPVVKELRAEKQREKGERRTRREADLAKKILAMPETKYGCAITDDEWDLEPWSRETGMDRHPSNHYPTAAEAHTPEEIVARTAERFQCLADDCVLEMWTTIPHLAIALKVMELRGFTYKSQRVWNKVRPGRGRGTGYWVTGEHEIILIGTRGKVVAPDHAHFRSSFEAPVGKHSEKPDQQYELAEFHFPNVPKIEFNARRARAGWFPWGLEAPPAAAGAGLESARSALADMSLEEIHEARMIRDAEVRDPGIVRRSLDDALARGEEPSREHINRAISKPVQTIGDFPEMPDFLKRDADNAVKA